MKAQMLTFILQNKKLVAEKLTTYFKNEWIAKHKEGDRLITKVITENEERKNIQHSKYWVHSIKCVANYVPGAEAYVIANKNGKLNYRPLHRHLMVLWAQEQCRPDLIEMYPTKINKKIELVAYVSESFEKLSQKDANDYFNWVSNLVFKHTEKTIEEIVITT